MNLIMIVDNDQDILQIVEYIFEREGMRTISFEKGLEALDYLKNQELPRPDLIILDVNLPDVSGLVLLQEIKKLFQEAPPVLMLSALSQEENILKAYQNGAKGYVTKPFVISILIQKSLSLIST
jgi:DNA-binding response OmpR family regulator